MPVVPIVSARYATSKIGGLLAIEVDPPGMRSLESGVLDRNVVGICAGLVGHVMGDVA